MAIESETLSERSERINVELAAEEYRRKGYRVSREPRLDFLPGYTPDFVAEKDGEKRVIEVKSRSSLLGNDKIVEMAKAVYSRPGWSFDLRMIGEPEALDTPQAAQSYGVDEVVRRLNEADRLRQSGLHEPAFMLAWAACEAAIRELMVIYGIKNTRITTTTHLFDQATYHGVISRDDYFHLLDTASYRNAFAHGFSVTEFDPELISELIVAVRKMTEAIARGPIEDEDDDQEDFWPSTARTRNGDNLYSAMS